jgi:ceramide glucosyltransferase
VLLGVRSVRDPAWPLARELAARFSGRVRVVVQRGEPGRNPKVNQLIGLAAAARHDVLVVSDSNVRVARDYLDEITAHLDDEEVGLVTHPIAGAGPERLGSLLDALHLGGSVGPGMIGAYRVAGRSIVVGKSMALRRRDLERLGGFASVRDHLAEDWVLGRRVETELGKRVVIARASVWNVTRNRSLGDFYRRYRRWGVIHRQAVGWFVYLGEMVLNPVALATLAVLLDPSATSATAAACLVVARMTCDGIALRLLDGSVPVRGLLAVPLRDLLLAAAWWHGLRHDTVEWRGNALRVGAGTMLSAPEAEDIAPALARHGGR